MTSTRQRGPAVAMGRLGNAREPARPTRCRSHRPGPFWYLLTDEADAVMLRIEPAE
jgi:hypothetical protein